MNVSEYTLGLVRLYWRIFDFFAAPGQKDHPVKAYKLHSLLFIFGVASFFMSLFAVLIKNYLPSPPTYAALWGCVALTGLGLLSYRKWFNLFLAANTILLGSTAFIFIFCWTMDGFRQTIFAWFGLVPIVAGMLTNRRIASLWLAIVLGLVAFGHWATNVGLATDLLTESGHLLLTPIHQIGFLLSIGAITLFILQQQKVASDYLREKVVSKQNLLRILVHDISNPLAIMRLTGQMLAQENVIEASVAAAKIQRSADQMTSIISLIRDMESFDSNQKHIAHQPIELVALLDQVVELVENRIAAKNIRLAKFYASEVYVLGNETMLVHQIFGNIISNAIKFSHPRSRIEIGVEPLSIHEVAIIVRDYGIGIPPKLRGELFDPFSAISRQGTAGEKGTGFGLPITKNCVELLGGRLRVRSKTVSESPEDHGTSVTVILKRAPSV